jgi:hypothetical protein
VTRWAKNLYFAEEHSDCNDLISSVVGTEHYYVF